MVTDVKGPPKLPTEVLIPEARQHRRRRYVRLGIVVALGAIVIAGLVASAAIAFGGAADGKSQAQSTVAAANGAVGRVYFRPVLCFAPAFVPGEHPPSSSGPPSCSAASLLSLHNTQVTPEGSSPAGFTSLNVPPDPALAGVPSTKSSADKPTATILIPGVRSACDGSPGVRCVLGPAQISSRYVQKATVSKTQYGAWVVNVTFSPRGAALWDKVANENFHLLLAIELNGVVYSAPIIQPTQSSFSSFDGKAQISGSLTRAQAQHLARAMQPHSG